MKLLQRLPSCAALLAAIAIVGLAARTGLDSWQANLLQPDRLLMSLTLIGVAILLWPLTRNQPTNL